MKNAIIIICVIGFTWCIFNRPAEATPGSSAPDAPKQTSTNEPSWNYNEYTIKPLAEYTIKARILHKNAYLLDEESKLSPLDLALGWGIISDPAIYKKVKFSQSGRWYYYEYGPDLATIGPYIYKYSANTHTIPANDSIKQKLLGLRENETVTLKGFLVEVTKASGWQWKSSLSRDDTGGGSCELMWVSSVASEN